MKLCPGKALKMAAIRSLEICLRDDRSKPPGPCRVLLIANGGRWLLTCSCGAVSTWRLGPGQTAGSRSWTSLTELTEEDIPFVTAMNCESLWLPCTKNSGTDTFTLDEYKEQEKMRLDALVSGLAMVMLDKHPHPFRVEQDLHQRMLDFLM